MRVASLPMYDLPEVSAALDDLWDGLARHFRREGLTDVPDKIVHQRPVRDLWDDPNLWLSQCCGYDLVSLYGSRLQPLATPHFAAPECKGADYASVIIVTDGCKATDVLDMRGAVCVINGPQPHSGMNALRGLVAPVSSAGRFFSKVKESGSHIASLGMLRRGEADVAAIDCVTYALLRRYRPQALSGTHKLGRTYRAPGIPYVTHWSKADDTVARVRNAIFQAFADPMLAGVRQALLLKDVEELPTKAYRRITEFEELAARNGYARLN